MSNINIHCVGSALKLHESPVLATGSQNSDTVTFEFSSDWNGYTKTAVFYRDPLHVYHVLLSNSGVATIPTQVNREAGNIYIGVFGITGETIKTSQVVKYQLDQGAITSGSSPPEPTPDIYVQLIAALNAVGNGSPKGVYANLAALQAAFPTGAVGVYCTSDNGHWYFYGASGWTDGGVYRADITLDTAMSTTSTNAVQNKVISEYVIGLANTKQNKSLVFTNVSVSNWVADSTYEGYTYKADITCTGVTSSMIPEVAFSLANSISGNYAPIAVSGTGIVTIYGKVNTTITIPTIEVRSV